MPLTTARDGAMHRCAAHLLAALEHADARARDDDDLLSPWSSTAHTISLAAAGLRRHLDGPVQPAEDSDCLAALTAASRELASVRADHELPLGDLASAMAHLTAATQHALVLEDRSAT